MTMTPKKRRTKKEREDQQKKILKWFQREKTLHSEYKAVKQAEFRNISETSLKRDLQALEKAGYFKLKRGPRNAKSYSLTLRGLILTLVYLDIHDLDKFAQLYNDKLLTFQEWETIKKFDAIDEVKENLEHARKPSLIGRSSLEILTRSKDKDYIKDSLDSMLLGIDMDVLFLEKKHIVNAVNQNPTLKKYFRSRIEKEQEGFQKAAAQAEKLLKLFS